MNRAPQKKDAKAIFSAAIEYYMPEQWEGYIVTACGEDEGLRQRVRELLAAHQQGDSFLDREGQVTEGTPVSERPGMQIGPYKLLQEIGEGGFGVVYMAEQVEPVRRKVALKIIKPGMDTKQVIARFEAERQALAMMDHPNIAKVLDAGSTDSGRPYFVMELVKGVPITEFCDTNRLPSRERLQLFTTVCRAVQHAHQKGVIHRDLKPSNVMVTLHDNKPMPVIIDFGVSKAISHQLTEKTLFTAYGQMVGTPAYMSPEQAQMSRMDIDTRSDVYSLGVLLYELLTGSTPIGEEQLRGTAYAEMQRLIREEEAPRPSTRLSTLGNALAKIAKDRSTDPRRLGQFIRGDLDWIVMKALEKERNRRYETANGLANDLERFLNDEAVEACPPSLVYQARKFVNRHRAVVTTASVVAAAILLGIIGTTVGMIRAKRGEAQAIAAVRQAESDRSRADTLAAEKQQEARAALTAKQEAERLRGEAEAQVAKQLVSRAGIERQRGDITLAALLDAEALRLDHSDPTRELSHRRRLAADLNQCPRPTHLFSHDSKVLDARFSRNGKWIVTGCEDGMVCFWDAKKGTVVKRLPHEHAVEQVAFCLDDTRLLTSEAGSQSASGERVFNQFLWDWKQGKKLAELPAIFAQTYAHGGSGMAYGVRLSDTELQMISVTDGAPIGQPLNEERSIAGFRSFGEHVLVVTRDQQEQETPGERSFRTKQELRCLLWTPQTGQMTTLVDLPEATRLTGDVKYRFNGDGTLVAVLHSQTILDFFETASGQRVGHFADIAIFAGSFVGFRGGMDLLGFSPDNRFLMLRSNDQIALFDIANGKLIKRRISTSAEGAPSHFSPDSKRVLSTNLQGHPQLWHTSTGEAASPSLQHDVEVQQLSFSPDGHFVAVVYVDGTVRIWDSTSGEPAGPLLKHSGSVTGAAFSIDGSHLLVTAGENVLLWPVGWPQFSRVKIAAPSAREITPGEGLRMVSSEAKISPNGKWVVTSTSTIEVADRLSAELRPQPKTHLELRVWETTDGKEVHAQVLDFPSPVLSVEPTFSPDNRQILIRVGGFGGRGRLSGQEESQEPAFHERHCLWSPESGTLRTIESDRGWSPAAAKFSLDSQRLWTVFAENGRTGTSLPPRRAQTQLWDCQTGKPLGPPMEHPAPTSRRGANTQQELATGSPDGLCFAKVEVDPANVVVLLDATTGKPLGPPLEHSSAISKIQFSADGRFLSTLAENSDDLELKVWNTDSCSLVAGPITYPKESVSNALEVRLNSTATHVAIHSSLRSGGRLLPPQILQRMPLSTTVAIDELSSGKRIILRHELNVTGADFSPDGRYLLTTSRDNVVRIWDAQHGALVRSMRLGVPTAATAPTAQFSDDGQRIVARNNNLSVRVWDVATGQPLSAPLSQGVGNQPFGARGQPASQITWSSAADRFLLKSEGAFTVYDLSAEDRAVDELQRMTRVLSGRYVNQLGNVETLPPERLQQEWSDSIDSLHARLLPAPTDTDWHREQLRGNVDRFAEVWHLDRLIPADPNDGALYERRGEALAKLNRHEEAIADLDMALDRGSTTVHAARANSLAHLRRWREAADDLAIAIESRQGPQRGGPTRGFAGPGNDPMTVRALMGLALLLAGDREGYDQACQEYLFQSGNTARAQGRGEGPVGGPGRGSGSGRRPTMALQILLLIPRSKEFCDEIEDRFQLNAMPDFLRQMMGVGPLSCDGLIAYRRGQFAQTLELLGDENERTSALNLLLMAMASKQLGESDEATRRLSRAKEKIASTEVEPEPLTTQSAFLNNLRGTNVGGQTWVTAAIEEVLLREAEQMIEGDATVSN